VQNAKGSCRSTTQVHFAPEDMASFSYKSANKVELELEHSLFSIVASMAASAGAVVGICAGAVDDSTASFPLVASFDCNLSGGVAIEFRAAITCISAYEQYEEASAPVEQDSMLGDDQSSLVCDSTDSESHLST
jgi:hypothetical protein